RERVSAEKPPALAPDARGSRGGRGVVLAVVALVLVATTLALAGLVFGLLTLVHVLPAQATRRPLHERTSPLPVGALIASTYGLIGVAVAVALTVGRRRRGP